jgi:hypothetical protein
MVKCDRCGENTNVTIMSKFNRDTICLQCKIDEEASPHYPRASEAEARAVRDGDYNFPGIGLAAEDLAFLDMKRRSRRVNDSASTGDANRTG